jgi:uncharacterized protein (DUF1697 family)
MPRFVAFLRGINIGGHLVKKERLQAVFAALGFRNVATFRQSGNVIFETSESRPEVMTDKVEAALKRTLGFEVSVFVRTIASLKKVVELDPFKGVESDGASLLVTMLPTPLANVPLDLPVTIPKSTAQVISASGAHVFSVTHGGGEGALPNPFLESKLKVKTTTRNMNTVRDIVEKFGS